MMGSQKYERNRAGRRLGLASALTLLWILAPVCALAQEAISAAERAELEQRLEEARQKLDEAAGELGELHTRLYALETTGHRGRKPMLGVLLGEGDPAGGISLIGVTPGSGAEVAGLEAGDVLTAVNGVDLLGTDHPLARLKEAMQNVQPGDAVPVGYRRQGASLTADVVTQAKGVYIMGMTGVPNIEIDVHAIEEAAAGLAEAVDGLDFTASAEWVESLQALENLESLESLQALSAIGPEVSALVSRAIRIDGALRLEDVTEDLAGYFGVEQGVLVLSAPAADGSGAEALKGGDILLAVNGESVQSTGEAYRLLQGSNGKVSVEVLRHGVQQTFEVAPSPAGRRHETITIRTGDAANPEIRIVSPGRP